MHDLEYLSQRYRHIIITENQVGGHTIMAKPGKKRQLQQQSKWYLLPLQLLAIQPDRHRPVIQQLNLHIRTKNAACDR